MDIKFYWNGSIVGISYHLVINGEEIDLGLPHFANDKDEVINNAIQILKKDYGIDYDKNDIKFIWGGRL